MSNSLIQLLLAYGPSADGNAMYDEFVEAEAKEAGFAPLTIPEDGSDRVVEFLEGPSPCSVILTGTAGDGKTYTARQAFAKITSHDWKSEEVTNVARTASGQDIIFIKDLSELSAAEKDAHYPKIIDALEGESNDLFVLCVNDGQLLAFFRDRSADRRAADMGDEIKQMLQDGREEPSGGQKLRMLHMSRRSHAKSLKDIFEVILEHEGWDACAASCSAAGTCPILRNRETLRAEDGIFRQRIEDIVELAAADDRHLALRQLIILVVNTLLGVDGRGGSRLMDCGRAKSIAAAGDYSKTNPFTNVLGLNQPIEVRRAVAVFDTLGRLEIGDETTNRFDNALLDEEEFKALPQDDMFGLPIFRKARSEYAERPLEAKTLIRDALRVQRRRLFFTMSVEDAERFGDPWLLTKFYSGAAYLKLAREMTEDGKPPSAIADRITIALNRTMTGLFTETNDAIWLTRPSGNAQGKSVPLLVDNPIPWRSRGARAVVQPPREVGRPICLKLIEADKDLSSLTLSPTMFEYCWRVSDGALPGSFGSKCLQEIRTFQIKANGAFARLSEGDGEQLRAIRLRPKDGILEHHPIRILEVTE